MTAPRVLLIGYYGKGNFGDDVLLTVTHGLVRQMLPHADIYVIVDGVHGDYVKTMLSDITVLKPGRHGYFDFILHGGGGVFFDFKTYGMLDKFKHRALHCIGQNRFLRLERYVRSLTGKPRSSAGKRLGLGIGVGTYSFGSPRLRAAVAILADFDALWLRDPQSRTNLARFTDAMKAVVIEGSDLAFLTQYWLNEMTPRPKSQRPRLGIILRDWKEGPGAIPSQLLKNTLLQLARDYDITGFIFDRHADLQTRQSLAPYPTHVWQPETMTVTDFMQHIAQQDVLLTSRFHGALCGTCVGVPSVIVAIEPKLEQAALMLTNSASIVMPEEPDCWPQAVAQTLEVPADALAADMAKNRAASQAALEQISFWFAA